MRINRVAYLSGSPLVSTSETSHLPGPRSHILGTIRGLQANHCEVNSYICGDRFTSLTKARRSGGTQNSGRRTRLPIKPFLWDLGRIGLSMVSKRLALKQLGSNYDFVYERYGLFQSLGLAFQRRGIRWVLETN